MDIDKILESARRYAYRRGLDTQSACVVLADDPNQGTASFTSRNGATR